MNKVKSFTYKDAKGKVTQRKVWEVHPATDLMLALDLSEYDEEEQEFFIEQLQWLDETFANFISELGLKSNYRTFKKERITEG